MKKLSSILAFLFLISAGPVTGSAQNAAAVEPQLVYKALQDKDCRHWVDSVMDRLSFKEKVGQLFIYTIAPVDTKRNWNCCVKPLILIKWADFFFLVENCRTRST